MDFHFPQKFGKSHRCADDVLIWIDKRMIMPTLFGIIRPINSASTLNQCERNFICCQIEKDIDKGVSHRKMGPYMKDINIQYPFFNMVDQCRTVT